eukprot:augustus_masked-scaffold_5-processed-gene-10.51-mRNA-1 protein AED:0.19 eAED:1.00 QI:0/-1/0/1/-1/1/1/0/270
MVDYLNVIKQAETYVDDNTPWEDKFRSAVSQGIKEQADGFKMRFALQLEKQGHSAKGVIAKVTAIGEMFSEKAKNGNGKSLKYGGVEFSAVLSEFVQGEEMTFVERKKQFSEFDLDKNGLIDVLEFCLYLYKEPIIAGYLHRNGVDKVDLETDACALMKEYVSLPVFLIPQLDENILGLRQLKAEYEGDVQKLKDDAKTEILKRQLGQNLQKREKKYEEDRKSQFRSDEDIQKTKAKLAPMQQQHLEALEAELAKEAADALAPKKNLQVN